MFRSDSKDNWWIRFIVRGKEMRRSLGTPDSKVAIRKAKDLIELEINGKAEDARKLKVRSDYPTLKQLADRFIDKYSTDARRRGTAMGYVNALARIVRVVFNKGRLENKQKDLRALEDLRAGVLTSKLVLDYQAKMEEEIERDQYGYKQDSEVKTRTSICAEVGNARALFGRKAMKFYAGLVLPDLSGFMREPLTRPQRGSPQPIDDTAMEAICAAAPELAQTNPACYIAHLLFRFLGMRNHEIRCARMSWIRHNREYRIYQLGITYRPAEGFKPKKGTERDLTVSPDLMTEIQKHWKPSPDGDFIVPAAHKSGRYDVVDRDHNAWAGQWIKGMTQVSYELRRYAGSLVYRATKDPVAVQRFLGHKDFDTTQRWYLHCFNEPTYAITMTDFATPGAKVVPFDKSSLTTELTK